MNPRSDTPILFQYLKKYQQDPTSRIFAPLAEAYRKAGLVEEAIDIAREGLRVHPDFVGGRVALARALFDAGKYAEVIREIHRVVIEVPDNLVAQRLYAESNLMVGRSAEALSAYKMLLYYNPGDSEVNGIVRELESGAYQSGATPILKSTPSSPAARRALWMRKIETLQSLLLRVERMRARV